VHAPPVAALPDAKEFRVPRETRRGAGPTLMYNGPDYDTEQPGLVVNYAHTPWQTIYAWTIVPSL
jgi:hypothetical protein